MERGRHELLERRSELEEELADTHIDLRLVRSELVTHQEDLEGIIQERDSLRSEKAAYLQSHEREADLEEQLLVQKRFFEEQLRKLQEKMLEASKSMRKGGSRSASSKLRDDHA